MNTKQIKLNDALVLLGLFSVFFAPLVYFIKHSYYYSNQIGSIFVHSCMFFILFCFMYSICLCIRYVFSFSSYILMPLLIFICFSFSYSSIYETDRLFFQMDDSSIISEKASFYRNDPYIKDFVDNWAMKRYEENMPDINYNLLPNYSDNLNDDQLISQTEFFLIDKMNIRSNDFKELNDFYEKIEKINIWFMNNDYNPGDDVDIFYQMFPIIIQ